MIFPKNGTADMQGKLYGYCTRPKAPGPYNVVIEPMDLREFADKGSLSKRSDRISVLDHRHLVLEGTKRYMDEIS